MNLKYINYTLSTVLLEPTKTNTYYRSFVLMIYILKDPIHINNSFFIFLYLNFEHEYNPIVKVTKLEVYLTTNI
jgi:hypothetical protein